MKKLKSIKGSGDEIRVGDVFMYRSEHDDPKDRGVGWVGGEIYRLTGVHEDRQGLGPHINFCEVEKPEQNISACAWNNTMGRHSWRRVFTKLDQAAVNAWWHAARRSLRDGWYPIDSGTVRGKFLVRSGRPVEVKTLKWESFGNEGRMRHATDIKRLVREVGILTGFKLTASRDFLNEEKTRKRITKAVRTSPPKV